jgi:betaine reductase
MTEKKWRVVHYLNQFFGQIGGETAADNAPLVKEGPVGPGVLLQEKLGSKAEIVATVIAGDNYMAANPEASAEQVLELIKSYNPDVLIAGPAFSAGRYGTACGAVGKAVKECMDIPVVTAMYGENPAVELYRRYMYILPAGISAAGMREVVPKMATLALKLCAGEAGFPEEEGYFPQGYRVNVFMEKTGAARGVEMLLAKLKGEEIQTELPMPKFDRVKPAPAVKDMKKATVALVTSGGIVPKGNPDRLEAANASKWLRYDISGVNDLTSAEYESVHGGYDIVYANEDADRVLPLDEARNLEREGVIGKLFDYYYVTVGNTTAVQNAETYGRAIGLELKENGVDAVILTST